MPTSITTNNATLKNFLTDMRATMELNKWTNNAGTITGYRPSDAPDRIFIRDHVFALEALKYWLDATMLKNAIDAFISNQRADGSFQDYVFSDGTWGRFEVEADLEYILPLGVYQVWQATGDDTWMQSKLTALENGWNYAFTNSNRYDSTTGLVMREHTCDTWDGAIEWKVTLDPPCNWNVLTTDISGYYQSAGMIAKMYESLGNTAKKDEWLNKQSDIKTKADTHLWDSSRDRFRYHKDLVLTDGQSVSTSYTTFTHNDSEVFGVAGNAYALTRGLADIAGAQKALATYKAWKDLNAGSGKAMKYPWNLLHPAYPAGVYRNDYYNLNFIEYSYCNGGLMPFVGVKWAMAAFQNREYALGWELLKQAIEFYYTQSTGNASAPYGLATSYWPDGTWNRGDVLGDGWGCGPYIQCVIEEIVGVKSIGKTLSKVSCFPKWNKIGETTGQATVAFPASSTEFSYNLTWNGDKVSGSYSGTGTEVSWKFALTANKAYNIFVDGAINRSVTANEYGEVEFTTPLSSHTLSVEPIIVDNSNFLYLVPRIVPKIANQGKVVSRNTQKVLYQDSACTVQQTFNDLVHGNISTKLCYIKNPGLEDMEFRLTTPDKYQSIVSYSWDGTNFYNPLGWTTVPPGSKAVTVRFDLTGSNDLGSDFTINIDTRQVV